MTYKWDKKSKEEESNKEKSCTFVSLHLFKYTLENTK